MSCYSLWASQVALVAENPPNNAGNTRDVGLITGSGRSPGRGNGSILQYSCLENSMDRGVGEEPGDGIAKSQT